MLRPLVLIHALLCFLVMFCACRRTAPSNQGDVNLDGAPAPAENRNASAPGDGVEELQSVNIQRDQGLLADEIKLGDQVGDWQTEAFHVAIKERFKTLAKKIESRDWKTLPNDLLTDSFVCSQLRPDTDQLKNVFKDENVTVLRPSSSGQVELGHSGRVGLENVLRQLTAPFANGRKLETHFKVFKVRVNEVIAESETLVDVNGIGRTGAAVDAHTRPFGVTQNMGLDLPMASRGEG